MLPLNPLYTAGELRDPLTTAGVKLVVTLTPFYTRLKDIQPETPVKRIIATSIKEYLPPLLRVLFTLFKEKKGGHRIALEPGDLWFQDCLRGTGRSADLQVGPGPAPDDPAIMLMSGGTTGMPKAVVGPHRCLVAAGVQLATWLHPPKGAPPDIALVPLPLFHVYACVGVQSHSIISRTPMALVPNPRDIADLLKTIKTVRPTLFSAVPALFIALLNHPKVKNKSVDFSSIRACFSGAAPLMAATKDAVRSAHGRPDRRRLFADRSDDGVHRESAERHQQGGLGRCAASRRRSRDCRCRVRHAVSAESAKPERSFCARRS